MMFVCNHRHKTNHVTQLSTSCCNSSVDLFVRLEEGGRGHHIEEARAFECTLLRQEGQVRVGASYQTSPISFLAPSRRHTVREREPMSRREILMGQSMEL